MIWNIYIYDLHNLAIGWISDALKIFWWGNIGVIFILLFFSLNITGMLLNYLVVLYSPWWYLKSQLHIYVTFKWNFIIRLKLGTNCEYEKWI